MRNPWIGQHQGRDDPRLIRISPYMYTQHGLLNMFYIPKLRDLPQSGLDLKATVFDFGFDPGSVSLGPKATAKINLQTERPLMLWGISGYSNEASSPQIPFLLQVYHTHQGHQRQFFNKHVKHTEICGAPGDATQAAGGGNIMIFRYPYVVIKGDQLTVQVKNLSRNTNNPGGANTSVQVVLWGGEFD